MTTDDLKAMWPGKAIFTAAFLRTLPAAPRARAPDPLTDGKPLTELLRVPIRTRGRNVRYEPGPMRHRKGKLGENWTNYMVRTILAHTCTADAEQAHRQSGVYTDKKLDFNWMFKNQYITKVQP